MSSRQDKAVPLEDTPGHEPEPFLARWSRRKDEARRDAEENAPQPPAQSEAAPPELPPIDKLSLDSDFRGFMHPKVSEDQRRAALKKLFSEPHFNVMDGLDVYIEDYSKTEPIPAAMLATLRQAQKILEWAKEDEEQRARQSQLAGQRAAEALPSDSGISTEANVPRQTDQPSENAGSATKA
jgi:uncharacterized protein DUF3306